MKKYTGMMISSLLSRLFFIVTASQGVSAADDNAAKLQTLENAVSTPAKSDKKKYKSRAIVFDADPTVATAPAAPSSTRAIVMDPEPKAAPVAAQKSPEPQKSAAPTTTRMSHGIDCTALPADLNSVTVDFALQFEQGRPEVAPSSEPMLREIAKILSLNREGCILVVGHNDAIGNPYLNMELSYRRANWVVNFIAEQSGLDRNRLIPIGMGSSEPLKNLDPRDPKNRRVVFMVVG